MQAIGGFGDVIKNVFGQTVNICNTGEGKTNLFTRVQYANISVIRDLSAETIEELKNYPETIGALFGDPL